MNRPTLNWNLLLTREDMFMSQTAFASSMIKDSIMANLIAVCPDGIIGVDRLGIVVIFNAKAAALTGLRSGEVLGKTDIGRIYGSREQARRIKAAIYSEDFGGIGRLDGFETTIVNAGNRSIPIRLSASLIIDNGAEVGSVGFFHDLTRQKSLEEKLRLLSITDGLTALYNQRHFHTCLADEMDRVTRYDTPLSMICFDLDKFKECNDRLGHLEGDNVLRLVGNLLHSITRRTDKAFRYGGDEFFVLLPETKMVQAMITAEKIRRQFNESWPYAAGGSNGRCRVTLSMGVVQRETETTGTALMKRADVAMYKAKNQGGDQVVAG